MNRLSKTFLTAALASASLLSFGALPLRAQGTAPAAPAQAAPAKAPKVKAPPPTPAEISDAQTKGLVWVNLNTKKYHKSGVATYGTTKNGQFMTEADAQKAGYKAAQEPMMKAKKTATSTAAPK